MTISGVPPTRGTAEWDMYKTFQAALNADLDGSIHTDYDPQLGSLTQQTSQHIIEFTKFTHPNYIAEPAHWEIGDRLMGVLKGDIKRLMIFAPPQHGKSELVSVRLPAFWFGHRPNDPVIFTSYGATHATSKAGEARDLIDSPQYARVFPDVRVSPKTRGKASWKIYRHQGKYEAVGMGGPITGFGTRLGIIDDPIKNWAEAQSSTIREQQWNWYRGTFRTRVWEGGAIILIMTRWHEDDLAGKLLKSGRDEWTVLRLPAVAEPYEVRTKNHQYLNLPGEPADSDPLGREPGEALCPIRYSVEELKQIKIDVGSMVWYAEYQATPRAPEGNWLKRNWFTVTSTLPPPTEAIFVRYWDKAGTEGAGKYSSGVLMSFELAFRRYTLLDVVRGRWSALRRERIIYDTAVNDRRMWGHGVQTWVEQEPGSGGKDQALTTVSNLRGFDVHKDVVRLQKEVRLNPGAYGFQAQCEAGFVYVLKAPWNEIWFDEITTIPNSAYWDQTDATTGAFRKLNDNSNQWEVVQNLGVLENFTTWWD